jgi:hypothetical protein
MVFGTQAADEHPHERSKNGTQQCEDEPHFNAGSSSSETANRTDSGGTRQPQLTSRALC